MAHEVETMAYNKAEVPWHGLGIPVNNDLSANEMLVASGCDWEVAKHDCSIKIGKDTIYTGTQALVRMSDNKILSPSVGPDWEPVQNAQAFEFFDRFVRTGKMEMETAGSLRGGLIVWALAKVGKSFKVFGSDRVESYLLFSNSHQYGKATTVDFTPIRVVCNNTLTMALQNKSKQSVSINHRTTFDPDRVEQLLGIADMKLDRYKEAAEFLGSKRAEEFDVVEFFKATFPVHAPAGKDTKKELSKLAKVALDVLPNQPGAHFAEGSWWQAFNAVTYMADHVLCKEQDTRLFNAWYGGTKDTKTKALELAIDMAGKSKELVKA